MLTAEPSFLYSSRSCWYPQAHDHRLRDGDASGSRVPVDVSTASRAASCEPGSPQIAGAKDDQSRARKIYAFTAAQPLRYLAFIVSRFARVETTTIGLPASCPTTAGTSRA